MGEVHVGVDARPALPCGRDGVQELAHRPTVSFFLSVCIHDSMRCLNAALSFFVDRCQLQTASIGRLPPWPPGEGKTLSGKFGLVNATPAEAPADH